MQHFTFGAGRIALRPEPYRGADAELGLWQGFALASQEWSRDGHARLKLGASALALLLGIWLAGLWIADAMRARDARSSLEIVMLELPAPPEPAVLAEPEPIALPEPEPLAPEPEPIMKPEPVAKAKPVAKPPKVAPPPPPKPVQVAKPAPPPAPRPQPAPPVQVARPAFPAAPQPRVPALAPAPAAPAPRIAAARPPMPKPVIAIDAVPAPAATVQAAPRASQPARLALRPTAAPARPRVAPSFDLGAPAALAPANEPTPPAATARAAPAATASRHTSARSVARPPASLALPALSTGAPARDPGAEPTPVRVAARDPAPSAGGGQSRSHDPKLRGVALGSLASCVSDKQEDALKLQLVSLVSEPRECVSSAGRYRFVETRNLNAFLLWVERAPARPAADRCVELTHALACVRKHRG